MIHKMHTLIGISNWEQIEDESIVSPIHKNIPEHETLCSSRLRHNFINKTLLDTSQVMLHKPGEQAEFHPEEFWSFAKWDFDPIQVHRKYETCTIPT